jgi:CRISPR/Cas system CSM-associated protein Csm2 small subunit
MKYGRLTPKQFAVAEKLIIQEERQTEINVEELPTNLRAIVEYKGESKFVLDLQEKYKKYRRLTEKQVQAGYKAVDREIQKNSQKEVNIKLVGNTIKLGRNIARDIKEENNLEFHPILVDVTEIVTMSNRAMKLKAKLTKENGGICRCCGKTLTDYMSQVTGIGPVCAKYVGVEHPKTKNDVEQFKSDMSKKIDEIGEFEFWIPKRQIVQWNGSASLIMKVK